MKILDYIVIALIAVWFIAAVIITVKNKKKGKCGGCCGNCPYGNSCRRVKSKKNSQEEIK